ncbi:MAG TPA: hypothetical protein VFR11_03115 [Micromonosporaceae bacterium]|nr:hypothetical protein [Micromonosporaceae bacterium]
MATAVLVALVGCAQRQTLHAVEPNVGVVSATYAGPLTHRVDLQYTGFSFDRPGTQAPAISPATAFAHCARRGICIWFGGSTTVYLARVTTDNLGGMSGQLAYLIVSTDFKCSDSGGPALLPGMSPRPVHVYNCFGINFMDATRDAGLGAIQTGDPHELELVEKMH